MIDKPTQTTLVFLDETGTISQEAWDKLEPKTIPPKVSKEIYDAGIVQLVLEHNMFGTCFNCGMPFRPNCTCRFCGDKSPHVKEGRS